MRSLLSAFLFWLIFSITHAQDLHFTNYRSVTNFFNPASTGDFRGLVKVQAAARTQYDRTYEHGVLGAQLSFDSPLKLNHWLAFGLGYSYDNSGKLQFRSQGMNFALAYHIPFAKDYKSLISIGTQFGLNNLSSNAANFLSEQLILKGQDKDLNNINNFGASTISFNSGINFRTKLNEKSSFAAGFSMTHINSPRFNILGQNAISSFGARYNLNANYQRQISQKLKLEPAIYFSHSEYTNNINLQLFSEWNLKEDKHWKIVTGLSNRVSESLDFVVGYKDPQFYVTVSYDYVYNDVNTIINGNGAYELGAYYIFLRKVKPKVIPEILCPRL